MDPVIESEPTRQARGDDWIDWFDLVDDQTGAAVDPGLFSYEGSVLKWRGGGEIALPLIAGGLAQLAAGVVQTGLVVDSENSALGVVVAAADTADIPAAKDVRAVVRYRDALNVLSTLLVLPYEVEVP